jgi:hypothetical protein
MIFINVLIMAHLNGTVILACLDLFFDFVVCRRDQVHIVCFRSTMFVVEKGTVFTFLDTGIFTFLDIGKGITSDLSETTAGQEAPNSLYQGSSLVFYFLHEPILDFPAKSIEHSIVSPLKSFSNLDDHLHLAVHQVMRPAYPKA